MIGVEIQQSAGSFQLCAGQPSGCEAAIYALRHIYDADSTQAALLVDASNAFNNLNRQLALVNISTLCPVFSQVLNINTYHSDAKLFVGGETILSQEGTTQGDPLAMACHAKSGPPIFSSLRSKYIKIFGPPDSLF